jgi:hypothetical protein
VKSNIVLRSHIGFAALEGLDAEVDINSAWETIRKSVTNSGEESLRYYELKPKPWFKERCLE